MVVNYTGFKQGWDEQIMPLSRVAPMIVTEMDWAPSKYRSSWGKSDTGVAGGKGFGANFRRNTRMHPGRTKRRFKILKRRF